MFSHLPALLMREMATDDVAVLLDRLVEAGWRPGQLRHRVGAAPSQGSVERDAAALVVLLTALTEVPAPDVKHAAQRRERARELERDAAEAPVPAAPEVREQHLAQLRATLGVPPRRRAEPAPRTRAACRLCSGEGSFFVTHDVHLCRRCVALMATGEARLSGAG